jgi:hypothetical protein
MDRVALSGEVAPRVIMLDNLERFRHSGPLTAEGRPEPKQMGRGRSFVNGFRPHRFRVEWLARRPHLRIVWPKPTHGLPASVALKPRQAAAEPHRIGVHRLVACMPTHRRASALADGRDPTGSIARASCSPSSRCRPVHRHVFTYQPTVDARLGSICTNCCKLCPHTTSLARSDHSRQGRFDRRHRQAHARAARGRGPQSFLESGALDSLVSGTALSNS